MRIIEGHKTPAAAPQLWEEVRNSGETCFDFIERTYGVEPDRGPLYQFQIQILDPALEDRLNTVTRRYSSDVRIEYDNYRRIKHVGQDKPTIAPAKSWTQKDGRYYFADSFAVYYEAVGALDPLWHLHGTPFGLKILIAGTHIRPEYHPWPEGIFVPALYKDYKKRLGSAANPARFFLNQYGDYLLQGRIYSPHVGCLDPDLQYTLHKNAKISDIMPTEQDYRRRVWLDTFEARLPPKLAGLRDPDFASMHAALSELADRIDARPPRYRVVNTHSRMVL